MPEQETTPEPKLDIDWIKTAAGALAAVTTAVILSTLGAAGTLIGAAIGSVAATLGSALYTQGLAKSKQTVLKAQETALLNLGVPTVQVRHAREAVAAQDEDVSADPAEPVAEVTPGEPAAADEQHHRWAGLPWKRIGVLTAGTFVVVMLLITGFELASGHSVSSYTHGSSSNQGSTFGGVTGNSGGGSKNDGGGGGKGSSSASPSASSSASSSPSATASESPSATPTDSATPTETATPTEAASPSPSATPSATPSTAPSATPTRTPTSSTSP